MSSANYAPGSSLHTISFTPAELMEAQHLLHNVNYYGEAELPHKTFSATVETSTLRSSNINSATTGTTVHGQATNSEPIEEKVPTSVVGEEIGTIENESTTLKKKGVKSLDSVSMKMAPQEGHAGGKSQAKARPVKGKGKAGKRMKWSNAIIAELLRLRFKNAEVKNRIDSADTKIKTALAWQFFASVFSQTLGVVITQHQVSQKYRKLKCLYQKEKREMKRTGNNPSALKEVDDQLWAILSDAFSSKEGLSGDVLADTNDDMGAESLDEKSSEESSDTTDNARAHGKVAPVAKLAHAMETDVTAIATAMGSRLASDENFRTLAAAMEHQTRAFQAQQQETRRFLELQLQLLQRLLEKKTQRLSTVDRRS
ncbi:uncharacterized protein IUM83_19056 [Phytophthora cinnamomi]|uniref:uncharacterized protein n=1 Tax=Phytophthora cinnamomi TaxID=4785 RepID=UPI003559DC0D|nr:hypothetical protein IUM83_19056 [Phytophthora cinnamomi]